MPSSNKFLKPHIPQPGLLDAEPGNPLGYVTNDGMWAAVPCGKKFTIIHNGSVVHQARTYDSALNFIKKGIKNEDQNGIEDNEPSDIKWNRGLDIFIESVHKPDSSLRQCAHNQRCYNELMWVRENVLTYLKSLRK